MSYQIKLYRVPNTISIEKLKNFNILIEQDVLQLFYSNGIKTECFEMAEMLEYFFYGFSWEDKFSIDRKGEECLFSKKELLNLIEWYIALSFVFNSECVFFDKYFINLNYLNKAKILKNEYKKDSDFFSYSLELFIDLKKQVLSSDCLNYIWEYNF